MLGLGSKEIARTLNIKKPFLSWTKDRRDPCYLGLGDMLILRYGSRTPLSGQYDYYQLVTEVVKNGLEYITIRPVAGDAAEGGLRLNLIDFSVNGFRFEATPEFVNYVAPYLSNHPVVEQLQALEEHLLLFAFYPRLSFNREIEAYYPMLPKRISLLGRIVRSDIEWEDEGDRARGRFRTFGIKMMYDPVEYSRDEFRHTRWEMIRPFKENRYFKEVHRTLNGLIAFLENQSRKGPNP